MGQVVVQLPPGVTVFERGWLSSNSILIQGLAGNALIDSGYCTHAEQTVALVQSALGSAPLHLLINTHLHSDHCGGNAALQAAFPALRTLIPPGLAAHVRTWNAQALTYEPTGQRCPPFRLDDMLLPGAELQLGEATWQVHAAPGHDTHSLILFEPVSRTLISADALWERGFGVVFPQLDGDDAFAEVADTLDVIEALRPALVIPGHGGPFVDVAQALAVARKRLQGFVANPHRHLHYAAKVLLKFKLLEVQAIEQQALQQWVQGTPYFWSMLATLFDGIDVGQAVDHLIADLVRSGAAVVEGTTVYNAG